MGYVMVTSRAALRVCLEKELGVVRDYLELELSRFAAVPALA
jgi:LytS/YehU family sensor histidine kinase